MRAEGNHRDPALNEIANAVERGGFAELDDGEIERLVARWFGAARANDFLQLAAKEEIAALERYALQPASFLFR